MKHWIQFTTTRNTLFSASGLMLTVTPYQHDHIGSFGVAMFDQRLAYRNIIRLCHDKLKNNIDNLTGFKVYASEYLNESNLIHEFNPTNQLNK